MAYSPTFSLWITGLALTLGCTLVSVDDDGAGSTAAEESSGGTGLTTTGEPTTTSPSSGSTDPTVTSVDSSGDGSMCLAPPVDEEIVNQLFITAPGLSSSVRAGEATDLRLVWIDNGFPDEVDACVEWSIDPVDGVTIDAFTGVLDVDASVPDGTIVSVTADLEDGRRLITADLEVYIPLELDILGFWNELQQLPCDGGPAFTPEPTIPELVFYDTGEFTVTWTPFEVYIDYWGTYSYLEGTGALVLTVEGGNYVPDDIDGEGVAGVVDGLLRLEDMWLGSAQEPVTPPACGHVFE